MSAQARRLSLRAGVILAAASVMLGSFGAAQALAGSARLSIVTRPAPSTLTPGGGGEMLTVITNLGNESVVATEQNPIHISETLPTGLIAENEMHGAPQEGTHLEPSRSPPVLACHTLGCTFSGTMHPYGSIEVAQSVLASQGFTTGSNEVRVTGGNLGTESATAPVSTSEAAVPFGVERFELLPEEESGASDVLAGSHPFALTTNLEMNQIFRGGLANPALLRNLDTTLPPGLIGDPLAVPQCSSADFATIGEGNTNLCPETTAIGVAVVTFKAEKSRFPWTTFAVPVFNLEPAEGEPARFGFEFEQVPVTIDTSVLTGGSYAVRADVRNASEAAEVFNATISVWGIPGAPVHDSQRGWQCIFEENPEGCTKLEEKHPQPYLTLPTYCSKPLVSSVQAQSWKPEAPLLAPMTYEQAPLVGCNSLPFTPSLSVRPDKKTASTPSGLTVEVKIPQEPTLSANGVAEADVKETELTFPEGLQANAGAANGLETCSVEAMGFEGSEGERPETGLESTIERQPFTSAAPSCPNASKIGEVEVHSPLLEHNLKGFAYLAGQDTDPFTSPLVLYFFAEDPISGVRVKLAGETRILPNGQLVGVFKNTPPLPSEIITLHLFDGPRASLATPPYCRPYEAKARFVTWSGQEATRTSSFTPEGTPTGAPCQTEGPLPFSPSVSGGSVNNHAGAYSPFTFTVNRPDGQQGITGVETALPPGMAAKLASVTPCQEPANEVEWSCGPESEIGVAHASSGLGADPVTLTGQAYLTTGYNGAPFGLLVRTLAKAGPFNLGYVNVRSRINVNEETAAVTVVTEAGPHHEPGGRAEELPTIFKGVPVQLKALNVSVNRPEFEFNGTNCEPMSIGAKLTASEGGSLSSSIPFQVTNCQALPFAPKFTATVAAQGSKANGVGATFTVESSGIGAEGIRKVFLIIPKILPARLQPTLQNACLDKVFVENPAKCPEDAFIGKATVTTPVLKNPLVGPAILVSHGNAAFPDVEFVLQSEGIHILLDGKTDIKKGITYSRFESAPDAPFTKFVTELPAGPHSIFTDNTEIVPTYNICGQKIFAPLEMTAQDGRTFSQETKVGVAGKCAAVKTVTPLEKALKACQKKDKGKKLKAKRESCEKAARKKYKKHTTRHSTKHTTKHSQRH